MSETRSTLLSECGAYEYEFSLAWEPTLQPVLFVMLNSNTDDYERRHDGRTTERCKSFARTWG